MRTVPQKIVHWEAAMRKAEAWHPHQRSGGRLGGVDSRKFCTELRNAMVKIPGPSK